MRRLVRLLSLLVLPAAFLVTTPAASAAPLPGAPARAAGLDSDWVCPPGGVVTGDGARRLLICVNNWFSEPSANQWRGVVQLRTQKKYGNQWFDSVSQTLTVNDAVFYPVRGEGLLFREFGNDIGSSTCRVNGASSSRIACSVPSTALVTYYGQAWNSTASRPETCTYIVSWRDDIGKPHTGNSTNGGIVCDAD